MRCTLLSREPLSHGKNTPGGSSASLLTIEPGHSLGDLEPPGFICLHRCGHPGPRHLVGGTQAREPKVQSLRGAGGCSETAAIPSGPTKLPKPQAALFFLRPAVLCRRPGSIVAEAWEASSLVMSLERRVSSGFRVIKWKVCNRVTSAG